LPVFPVCPQFGQSHAAAGLGEAQLEQKFPVFPACPQFKQVHVSSASAGASTAESAISSIRDRAIRRFFIESDLLIMVVSVDHQVIFPARENSFGFVDEDGRHFVEPGEFHLYVGDNDLVLFLE
jgi:hypothetical protein